MYTYVIYIYMPIFDSQPKFTYSQLLRIKGSSEIRPYLNRVLVIRGVIRRLMNV